MQKPCVIHLDSDYYSNNSCKACIRQSRKEYYQNNKESVKKRVSDYNVKNLDSIRERRKKSHLKNKDRNNAKSREYYHKDPERFKENISRYREKNREKILEKSRAKWHLNKETNVARSKKYREENREELLLKKKNYYIGIKTRAISHYSNGTMKCLFCSESNLDALALDHTEGGGSLHRRNNKEVQGHAVYMWVHKNEYPPIFRVLCHNCNYISFVGDNYKPKRPKLKVISHYSNGNMCCKHCSNPDVRVLTIDHINGGGRKEMARLGFKGGVVFYRYLINSGYPEGYQILCFNCNITKHISG